MICISTSRGVGNNIEYIGLLVCTISISTYLPREGPETCADGSSFQDLVCIAPYLPREGTFS